MKLTAAIATIVAGYLGALVFGGGLNWPNGDVVTAIAVMGFFILKQNEGDAETDDENDDDGDV